MNPALLRGALLALVLVALTAAAYFPGLGGSFIFDDFPNIVSNPRVHAQTLDYAAVARAADAYPGAIGRPLATITFAMDHAAAGLSPRQFKLTSLAVHLVNALLVFWLVAGLLRAAGVENKATLAAFVIALAWAVHPLQVSSVLYIVQRMETLSTTFVLAALIAYLRGRTMQAAGKRGWPWLAGSVVLAGISVLGKETGLLFPVYTLALEATVLGFRAGSASAGRNLRITYAVGAGLALLAFVGWMLPTYLDPAAYAWREFTMAERLLTQLRVLPMYLGWFLLPLPDHLVFYYDNYTASKGLLSPATTLAGGLLLAALFAAAIALRKRMPLFSLGLLWFFAAHLLTSNIVPVELVFEHRNYFALLGIALALYDLARRIPAKRGPEGLRVGAAVVVSGLFLLTLLRAATWGDPLLLASDLAARNPGSARASNDLGEQYMTMADGSSKSPFYGMATSEFERGAALPTSSPLPEHALILMAAITGEPAKKAWWDSLDRKLTERKISPQEKAAVFGLLKQRFEGLPVDDRRLTQSLGILFSREQQLPAAHVQFAEFAMVYGGDQDLAQRLFAEAIRLEPRDPDFALDLVAKLAAGGHAAQAEALLAEARELGLVDARSVDANVPRK